MDRIREKFEKLAPMMDERMMRLWLGAEAMVLGHGGVAKVTRATGVPHKRIIAGRRELEEAPPLLAPREQRIRRPGAGRPPVEASNPELIRALDALIDPVTRGDPESPLRWTSKSTRTLAEELTAEGNTVSASTVRRLLAEMGYSLQAPRKTKEGTAHPERNAQFEYINRKATAFQRAGEPVVSVDTKKKELIGDFKNVGAEWQRKGEPVPVRVHDFIDARLGKAIPYGVYDVGRNEGWMSVGIDHDTAEFAVATLRRWWTRMGQRAYPDARELLVTADAGGSNGPRVRLWKNELQKFSNESGLAIHVCHYPPGTSKWNKIEHRMFNHVTQNWRGRPLETLETVVSLIANTSTRAGLKIKAAADKGRYPEGRKISDDEMAALNIKRERVRGQWNYRILPA